MKQSTSEPVVRRTPTSMNIREELWDRVKIRAITKKMTATEFVEQALESALAKK